MAKEKTTAPEKLERFIYLGPNISSEGLQKYQVFKGGLPLIVDMLKEKYSLIEQLFAPVNKTNIFMQAIQTKGTPAYLAYEQILKGGKE